MRGNKMRKMLLVCEHCGRSCCDEYKPGMCKECSARYAKYLRLKLKVRTSPSDSVYQALYRVVSEYRVLKAAGFKVPRDV